MMKTLIAVTLSVVLSGCAVTVAQTERPLHKETEHHLTSQKLAFIEFHEFFVKNQNMPNSEPLKNRATELMFKAGLYHACHKKTGCYLVYGDKKIRFEKEMISIESYGTFTSVDDANLAAKVIYGA